VSTEGNRIENYELRIEEKAGLLFAKRLEPTFNVQGPTGKISHK